MLHEKARYKFTFTLLQFHLNSMYGLPKERMTDEVASNHRLQLNHKQCLLLIGTRL